MKIKCPVKVKLTAERKVALVFKSQHQAMKFDRVARCLGLTYASVDGYKNALIRG